MQTASVDHGVKKGDSIIGKVKVMQKRRRNEKMEAGDNQYVVLIVGV